MVINKIKEIRSIIKRCESDLNGNFKGSQAIMNKLRSYKDKLLELENSEEYKIELDKIKKQQEMEIEKEEEKIKRVEFKKRVDKIYKLPTKFDTNHRKEYKDEDLKYIFLSGLEYPIRHYQEQLFLEVRERIKRTWKAIEGVVRVRDSYLETGKIRKDEGFYQEVKKDGTIGLDKTGEQMKRVLDKLINEGKLISRIKNVTTKE